MNALAEKPLQFEIGVAHYTLDHLGTIKGVSIAGEKGRDLPLILTDLAHMTALHEALPDLRAVPTHAAFDSEAQVLWVHPSPKGEYVFHVEPGETHAQFGRLRSSPPSVALPPGTVAAASIEQGKDRTFLGTLTKPMLKKGR